MIGNWLWNLVGAATAAVVTFFLSVFDNVLLTTLARTCYSFLIIFFAVFLFRWILGSVAGLRGVLDVPSNSDRQSTIDLSTPEEADAIQQMLKSTLQTDEDLEDKMEAPPSFAPINPPRLVSKKDPDMQTMASAVRHMLDDEGR